MSDYINREDAIEIIARHDYTDGTIKVFSGRFVNGLISAIPSADVVEADKVQKEIDYWHDKAQSYEQTILKLSLNKADVVEVVRCKDCKYGKKDSLFVGGYECSIFDNSNVEADDYCSYGERKEE